MLHHMVILLALELNIHNTTYEQFLLFSVDRYNKFRFLIYCSFFLTLCGT
jgi:hypothetical protein